MNDKLGDLITEEQWKGYPSDEREWLTFNFLQSLDRRLNNLEKRKWLDKASSFAGGVLGGVLAVCTFIKLKVGVGG